MKAKKLFNLLVVGGALLGVRCATTSTTSTPETTPAPDAGTPSEAPPPNSTGQGAHFW